MKPEDLHERLVYYSESEELMNRLTHALGVLLSVVGAVSLIIAVSSVRDPYRFASVCIYAAAMVIFYSISTAYHSVRKPYARYILRILDHASIYLMIAGSYTPFTMVTLRGVWGWSLFGVVWTLGLAGAFMKLFTIHRLRVLGPFLYLALGWVVLVAIKPLSAALAPGGLKLLIAGGVTYTLGVIFYLWDRLPYNHAIWHLFVLTGSACHFLAVLNYVVPVKS